MDKKKKMEIEAYREKKIEIEMDSRGV